MDLRIGPVILETFAKYHVIVWDVVFKYGLLEVPWSLQSHESFNLLWWWSRNHSHIFQVSLRDDFSSLDHIF